MIADSALYADAMLTLALAATLLIAPSSASSPPSPPPPPPATGGAPAVPAVEEGFVAIFNGRDLTGWVGDTRGYAVEDGAIVCLPSGRNLYTEREYGDVTLRFEFRLSPGANNGIGLRTPREGDPAYAGLEVQVLDDGHPKYAGIKDWQAHGSVYGIAAAKRGHLRPAGEWNQQEIDIRGRRVKVTLNGVVILDVDLDEATKEGTLSGEKHPGLARTRGHIAFCGHGDRVEFRALRVRE